MDYVNLDNYQVEHSYSEVKTINNTHVQAISYSSKPHISISEIEPLISGLTSKEDIANTIVRYYRQKGYVSVNARVSGNVVSFVEAKPVITGDYAKYLNLSDEGVLTQSDLDLFIKKALPATRLSNQKVDVNISDMNSEDEINVELSSYDTLPLPVTGMSISATSFGPRYSASNVITTSAFANLGENVGAEASVTVGLADLKKESKGGLYHGFNGGFKYANHLGMFNFRMSDARYEVGGSNNYLNYHGVVDKYELEYSSPITNDLGIKASLAHNRNRTYIGLVDMNDIQTYNTFNLGMDYRKSIGNFAYGFDVNKEIGINGKRSFNLYELLGEYNSNYRTTSMNADMSYNYEGFRFVAKGGAQRSGNGTPSNSQFFIGGVDRGASYTTGAFSGYNGTYKSASIFAPAYSGYSITVQPSISMDQGKVKQPSGDYKRLTSASIGMAFDVMGVAGNVSLSIPVNDKTNNEEKKVNFFIIKSF